MYHIISTNYIQLVLYSTKNLFKFIFIIDFSCMPRDFAWYFITIFLSGAFECASFFKLDACVARGVIVQMMRILLYTFFLRQTRAFSHKIARNQVEKEKRLKETDAWREQINGTSQQNESQEARAQKIHKHTEWNEWNGNEKKRRHKV